MTTVYFLSALSTDWISRVPTTVTNDYLMITSDFALDFQKQYATYGIIDSQEIIEPTGRTNVEISLSGIAKSVLETGDVNVIDLLMTLYIAETNVYFYESYGTSADATKVTLGATGLSILTPNCYKIIDFSYSKKPGNEVLFYWDMVLKEVREE